MLILQEGNRKKVIYRLSELSKVYDFIRMLDCEGYPNAFLESKYLKLEMYDAKFKNDKIIASVKIIKK